MEDLPISCETILDNLRDGVYVCDRERKILYWSKAAERITGWRSEEVVGRRCLEDVLRHVDKDGHRLCGEEHCPLHRSMVTGAIAHVPLIVFASGKDDRRIPMHVTAAPIRNNAGEVVGAVETFRDVSSMLVDLERAKKIQSQSLEQDLPDDPRVRFTTFFMPHDMIGGDYYAIKQLDGNRYGFLLADMEGHGVSAALYTMHLRTLWNRYCQLLTDPREFAAAVNKELVRIFETDVTFAAAICGMLDARSGVLGLTGAGGPPPLIMHADRTVDHMKSAGVPFGYMDDVSYSVQVAELKPGDSILAFSDGAFEIHNSRHRLLGIDGLLKMLKNLDYPQTELSMDALAEGLLKFSNDIRLQDDVTIMEIRFFGRQSSPR